MQPLQTFPSGVHPSVEPARPTEADPPTTGAASGSVLGSVAYFSPEFGVSAALPQYAGGLGVLAGDHLKAAAALEVPLVGIGLFYEHGYFSQRVDADGVQHADYPLLDPEALGLREVDGVTVGVEVAGSVVHARVWEANVGGVLLYLLDTNVEGNAPDHRRITDRLYGGGPLERLRQELVLGVGGVRALGGLGISPEVFHLNEGHAGFSLLERLRRVMVDDGLDWDEAREAVRPTSVFTTHTPVPAGIDRFDAGLIEAHFGNWCAEVGVPLGRLMDLGHEPGTPRGETFNMAVLCLRLCGSANGVSQLHGEVSRTMFAGLWGPFPPAESPIGSITNGVDATTWVAAPMAGLLRNHLGPRWPHVPAAQWEALGEVSDDALWEVRNRQRADMVEVVAARQRAAGSGVGTTLDPDVLTIGFARRFATYKRAALLAGDPEALAALVNHVDGPVQFVFAGKAHPNDADGQAVIAEVLGCAHELGLTGRIVFVDDYDMDLAAALVAGCDVWLNTPVRPMEACGTSGMKAALNGGLNCSIPDGWWDEWGSNEVGWVIAANDDPDPAVRNEHERAAVFEILGNSVVPTFAERGADGVPHRWCELMRTSLTTLGPRVLATRMVEDYVSRAYLPAARRSPTAVSGASERVRRQRRLHQRWPAVAITEVTLRPAVPGDDGFDVWVTAEVDPGELPPDDLVVEAVWGPPDATGAFTSVSTTSLTTASPQQTPGRLCVEGAVRFGSPVDHGVTVRVVPRPRTGEPSPVGGLVCWAQATSGSPSSTA